MTPKFVVFLNGPPRSGKDTAAAHLAKREGWRACGFAHELKEMTHRLYGLAAAFDHYEDMKDVALGQFGGVSPRRAYIAVSEHLMKPLHGADVFGHMWLRRWEREHAPFASFAAVPDSGFRPEAEAVLASVGRGNALLIRLHREGCTYANDSRGYISPPDVRTVDIENCGPVAYLHRCIDEAIAEHGPAVAG